MPDIGRRPPHWTADHRQHIDELIDEYRMALHDSLNDLTEDEARRHLVPSKSTLLGLVKHVTFVEGVWFDQHAGHIDILREQVLASRSPDDSSDLEPLT